jgi:hypothetical protein
MTQIVAIIGQVKCLRNLLGISTAMLAVIASSPAHAATGARAETVGDAIFGAQVNYRFQDQSITGITHPFGYQARCLAQANGPVLGRVLQLASGDASLSIKPANYRAFGNIKIGGVTVAAYDRSSTTSATFTTAPFFGSLVGGTKTVSVGLLTERLSSKANVRMSVNGVVQEIRSPLLGLLSVSATSGPEMQATAVMSASVSGIQIISFPVQGNPLRLVDARLLARIQYVAGALPRATVSASSQTKGTDGKITFGPQVLADYHGTTNSVLVASGTTPL